MEKAFFHKWGPFFRWVGEVFYRRVEFSGGLLIANKQKLYYRWVGVVFSIKGSLIAGEWVWS